MEVVYTILLGAVKVILAVLVVYTGLLFTEYLHNLKEKIGKENWDYLMQIARAVVKAMEQIYGDGNGKKKKEEAMKFLTEYLHLSPEMADKLIEAAVYEMNHLWEILEK